jgi:methionyl-tRNA formyltransferase
VPTLAVLHNAPDIDVVGCATQPDRPVGRKRVMTSTPVGAWCAENGLQPEKPASVNKPEFLELLDGLNIDFILVFSFGQILKIDLLNVPRCECLNIHTSLLPRHRGASPVQAAILAGDTETGVSFMRMVEALDAGPVFDCRKLLLSGTETAYDLEEQMASLAADSVCDVLYRIRDGALSPVPQWDADATYAGKIEKNDGQIEWKRPAEEIARQIRAYYPWPGAWFILQHGKKNRRIVVTQGVPSPGNDAPPGTVTLADKHGWRVQCGHDQLHIDKLIPEGKPEMSGAEFLRGCQLELGQMILSS